MQRILLLSVAVVGLWPVALADLNLVGRVVKAPESPDLYYIGADGKRYFFPSYDYQPPEIADFDTHATWFADRSEVLTISRAELETYVIGGNVTMRPGIKLVGITSDPRVYVVMSGSVLRYIPESQLLLLYGPNWRDHFVYIPDAHFGNYRVDVGSDGFPRLYEYDAHPPGTLFRYPDDPQVFLMDYGSARPITLEGMAENGFRQEDVYAISRDYQYHEIRPLDFRNDPSGITMRTREERLTTPAGPIAMFNRTDVNGDGQRNVTDVINMLQALFTGTFQHTCDDAADANDDGQLDVSDAVTLLRYLFVSSAYTPPWPFSWGGIDFDPTADTLGCVCYRCQLPQVEVVAAPMREDLVTRGTTNVPLGQFNWRAWRPRGLVAPVTLDRLLVQVVICPSAGSGARIRDLTNLTLTDDLGRIVAGPVNPVDNPGSGGCPIVHLPFNNVMVTGGSFTVHADLNNRFIGGDYLHVTIYPESRRQSTAGPPRADSAELRVAE